MISPASWYVVSVAIFYFCWHVDDLQHAKTSSRVILIVRAQLRLLFPSVVSSSSFISPSLLVCRAQSEGEWRGIGVQQSRGWMHYALHRPEPHILLFRRPLGTDPQTGRVDPELARLAREDEYKGQLGLPETARAM